MRRIVIALAFFCGGGEFAFGQPAPECIISAASIRLTATNTTASTVSCTLKCQWLKPDGSIGEVQCTRQAAAGSVIECEAPNSDSISRSIGFTKVCGQSTAAGVNAFPLTQR